MEHPPGKGLSIPFSLGRYAPHLRGSTMSSETIPCLTSERNSFFRKACCHPSFAQPKAFFLNESRNFRLCEYPASPVRRINDFSTRRRNRIVGVSDAPLLGLSTAFQRLQGHRPGWSRHHPALKCGGKQIHSESVGLLAPDCASRRCPFYHSQGYKFFATRLPLRNSPRQIFRCKPSSDSQLPCHQW